MNRSTQTASPRRRSRRTESAFSLVEMLIAVSFLALGMLAHAATSVSSTSLMQSEARHSEALRTARHFTERLRSDVAWANLYVGLRQRFDASPATATAQLTDYFSDFIVPSELGDVRVLVEVPRSVSTTHPSGYVLRENVLDARFGLPYDLNGDGVVDGAVRDDDYTALPIVVTLQWQTAGDPAQRLRFSTWLRGDRP